MIVLCLVVLNRKTKLFKSLFLLKAISINWIWNYKCFYIAANSVHVDQGVTMETSHKYLLIFLKHENYWK